MNKKVILCVDDEEIILHSLRNEIIDLYGFEYRVELTESADEAIELFKVLKEQNYDIPVVIADYIMPGIKGDEFLKKIHEISPRTSKIVLSGQATVEGITNALNEANLFKYFEKPWKKSELFTAINEGTKIYYSYINLDNANTQLNKEMIKLDKYDSSFKKLETMVKNYSTLKKMGELFKNCVESKTIDKINFIKLDKILEEFQDEKSSNDISEPECNINEVIEGIVEILNEQISKKVHLRKIYNKLPLTNISRNDIKFIFENVLMFLFKQFEDDTNMLIETSYDNEFLIVGFRFDRKVVDYVDFENIVSEMEKVDDSETILRLVMSYMSIKRFNGCIKLNNELFTEFVIFIPNLYKVQ